MYSYVLCVGGSAVAAATAADSYGGVAGRQRGVGRRGVGRRGRLQRRAWCYVILVRAAALNSAPGGVYRRAGGDQLTASSKSRTYVYTKLEYLSVQNYDFKQI